MDDTKIANPNLRRLMEILDQVKTALKAGDIEVLDSFSKEQDRLLAKLAKGQEISEHQMRLLVQSAEHNQRLLSAAIGGLRSAWRRKGDIRDAMKTSQTYDRSGQRNHLVPVDSSLERRS